MFRGPAGLALLTATAGMQGLLAREVSASGAACTPTYRVSVTIDPGSGAVDGRETLDLECQGGCPGQAVVWLYPNRLAEPPPGLDAMNTYWIYPYSFEPGSMDLGKVAVDGTVVPSGDVTQVEMPEGHALTGIRMAAVSIPLPPGVDRTTIEIEFRARVPRRYGLFGRARKGMVLATGWHPVLAASGPAGWDLETPPPAAAHEIEVTLPAGFDAVIGDAVSQGNGDGKARTVAISGFAASVPIVAFRKLHRSEVTCSGVSVTWLGLDPRPPGGEAEWTPGDEGALPVPEGLPDVMALDRPLHAMGVACGTLDVLAASGSPVQPGTEILMVEIPLRLELAASTGGIVLVSDRMFDILPLRKAWKFHEFQLVRAVAASLVERSSRGSGDQAEVAMTSDFVASAIVERYTATFHGKHEDARDILKYGAFIAAVDYFLYSPLVEFREAYFDTIAEQDWLRDEPWAFLDSQPRGKLFWEKTVDLLGTAAAARIVDRYLSGEGSIRSLAREEAGEDLGWFWDQWSRPYPSLNYRVGEVESGKLEGGGYLHTAAVERQGDTWIREPVVVRFVAVDGSHVDAIWDAAGPRGGVSVRTASVLDRVVVDPEMRLFEDPSLTPNHPRLDNTSEPEWRPPVFAAIALTSNITELTGDIDVYFDLRRKYDLLNSISIRLVLATWGEGGTIWYSRGFGPKLDMDHSAWHAGAYLRGFHHEPGYVFTDGSGKWPGGTAITAGVFLGHDSRFYAWNPTRGWQASLYADYGLGIDDPGSGERGDLRHLFTAGTRAFFLWTPRGGHTLAFYGGAGGAFGNPYRGQLESLSSQLILRGFDADETFGRIRIYACFEWRHMFVHGLDWNIAHFITVQGIQGVLFAGAGTASRVESMHGLFAEDRLFTEVGYGLRLLTAHFGTYPSMIALDLAIPITPTDRPGRLPVALRLAFNQVF